MYLVLLTHISPSTASTNLSVWVEEANPDNASTRALAYAEAAGFQQLKIASVEQTCESDYFRACESRAAFDQAKREGIALRSQE